MAPAPARYPRCRRSPARPRAGRGRKLPERGVLRIGILGEPPALDAHWSTTAIVEILTNHIYEGLYTLDQDNRPIPMLAEGMPAVSRDGLVYVQAPPGREVPQRKGTWRRRCARLPEAVGQQANTGKVLFKQVADIEAVDRPQSSSVSRALAHHGSRAGDSE